MAIVLKNYKELQKIRGKNPKKTIVYCSGTFDLTHAGHVLFLEDAKKLGDILIVGIGRDVVVKNNKGKKRPILNQYLRLKMISSLKPVDYTVFEKYSLEDSLACLEYTFRELRPDVYAMNSDVNNINDRKKKTDKYGVRFIVLKRKAPKNYENISTSKIIDKIRLLK